MADIKRMNYFDQQFLLVGDFVAEQNYHRDMRLLHNKTLHTYGVASGLDVSLNGAGGLTVSAGMAIDKDGREIVLGENTPHTLTNDPASGPLLIMIMYLEVESDESPFLHNNFTRIKEDNRIIDTPETAPAPEGVTLARVMRDGQGNITVDASVRRWVGPLNDDTSEVAIALGRLRLGGKSIPNSQWPSLTASGPDEVTLGGSLKVSGDARVTGNITVNGRVGIGATAPNAKLHVVGDTIRLESEDLTRSLRLTVDGTDVDISTATSDLHINSVDNSGAVTPKNHIFLNVAPRSGNVGIGVTDPKAKLHVVGSIKSSMWNVTQVFDMAHLNLGQNLPLTSPTFNVNGGILVIFASGSGWRKLATDPPLIGVRVNIIRVSPTPEVNAGHFNMTRYANQITEHITFCSNARVLPDISGGAYKITITKDDLPHTVIDTNDFFSVTVFELPWQLERLA